MEEKSYRSNKEEEFSDIMNIQGQVVPQIDEELDKLLIEGLTSEVKILPGTLLDQKSTRKPHAVTKVKIEFENENDLRRCVRLLRWSDDRLRAMGSSIHWDWQRTIREGMTIKFGVNWYNKEFFEERGESFKDKNHISYFQMFGKESKDMEISTEILGT